MSFLSINGPCTQRKNIKWEKHINIPFNYNYIKYIDKRCFISLYELKIIWATIFWKEIASFIWVNFSLLNRGGQRIFWRFLDVFNNSQEWNVSFINAGTREMGTRFVKALHIFLNRLTRVLSFIMQFFSTSTVQLINVDRITNLILPPAPLQVLMKFSVKWKRYELFFNNFV